VIVCVCHDVSETDVVEHVLGGCQTPDEVAERTGASTSCGTCTQRLCGLVTATRGAESARTAATVA
jgi:bacterioferritin-associated ferredoxin